MLLQPERYFAVAERFDKTLLHGLPAEQLQDATLPLGKRLWSAETGQIECCLFNPTSAVLSAEGEERPVGTADMLSDLDVGAAFV